MLKDIDNPNYIIAAFVLIAGVVLSLYIGQTLKQDAERAWFNHATWTAEKATDTSLAWFALQQTQLRGIASLFYGSEHVTEDEFFDALDLIEVPGSLPLNSIAYATRNASSSEYTYIITHSSDLAEPFSPGADLVQNDKIISAIETAWSFPGEVVMSHPFEGPEGKLLFCFLITVETPNELGILIAAIDILVLLSDLTTLHIPEGLYLRSIHITGMADGSHRMFPFFLSTSVVPSSGQDFTMRVDSGKNHLEYLWTLSPEFLQGPATGLGNMVQLTGSLFFLTFFAILLFLLKENVWIKQKVEERTAELSAAIEKTNLEIIEKNTAEKALKASGERLKALSDASFEAILLSEEGVCTDVNNSAVNMFGYQREELVGADASLVVAPEYIDDVKSSIETGDTTPYEIMVTRKDGSSFPAGIQGRTIDYFGKKVRVTAITNITDRRQAEIAKQQSEEKYRTLIETTNTGFLVIDFQGNVLEANEEYSKILGYSQAEDVTGHNINEWIVASDIERNKEAVRECSLTGQCASLVVDYRTTDDTLVPVEINASVFAQDGQKVIMALVRDISHQKKLEEERLKAKKLESVGVLAGGIAHDFNNILVAILGNMSLARQYLNENDKVFSLIHNAEKASYRAKDLTQQLLTFAKGGDPVTKAASLERLIRDSADFILSGSKIACTYSFPADLWLVHIDPGQISQVIQNIIINSVQAIQGYGNIGISCANIDHSDQSLPQALTGTRYVQITIRDSGAGIPASSISKIFDPYFTTKEGGSGLGLALTHSIITKHQGHISVTSEAGQGTQFVIFLPAVLETDVDTHLEGATVSMGSGTILIMDDEELVRNVAKEMLVHLGYEVLLATDGEEAVDIFRDHHRKKVPIDYTIMDLTIPGGMGGKEAAEKILELDKTSKIIVSSGYSNDPIMSNFREYGFSAAIAKPFELVELSNVLKI